MWDWGMGMDVGLWARDGHEHGTEIVTDMGSMGAGMKVDTDIGLLDYVY